MLRKPFPILIIVLVVFSMTVGCKEAKADIANPAPPQYSGIYSEINASLDQADREISAKLTGKAKRPVFAVDLLVVNGNRGPELLGERTLKAAVMTLDRLKAMNIKAVTVAIGYPLFMPETPNYEQYISFYKKLREEVGARDMQMIVETGVVFPDPEFSEMRVDYSGLTIDGFKRVKRQMVETIVQEVRPDYLLVESEPLTLQRNTGLRMTPEIFADITRAAVAGLDKKGVKIGAGTGSWDNPAYFKEVAKIRELDYLDLHIYPVQRGFMTDRIFTAKQIADAVGKPINISEAWLYKNSSSELGVPGTEVQMFARDSYSFWMPLDMKFIDVTAKAAQYLGSDYCSFFWMQYLYGYVDYNDTTRNMGYMQLKKAVNQVAAKNIVAGTPNALGRHLSDLASR